MDQVLNQPIKDASGNVIGYASGASPTDVSNISNTITSAHLAPAAPIPYSTPNPTSTYPVGSLDTSIPTPPLPATPAEQGATDLTSLLKGLNDSLVGKSAYQTAQEAAVGIPGMQTTITDLSAKLTGLQNEAKAIPINLQTDSVGRGITAAGLAPIQSQQLRDNAVQALSVSTLLEAAKGNLANAQATADKAVKQKYDPIQEQITAATANLNLILNSPEYTKEEKDRAQQQLDIQNKRQATLDQQKSDTKAISDAAITGATYVANFTPTADYPTAAAALTAIAAAKTPVAATQIAAATNLIKPEAANTQVVEAGGRKQLINSKTGAVIKDLGAASGTSTGTGTAAERAAAAVSGLQTLLSSKTPLANGKLPIDVNGFITPEAWKALIAQAPSEGLSREDFIKQFGYLLSPYDATGSKKNSGGVSNAYGLTAPEIKLVTGALPGE